MRAKLALGTAILGALAVALTTIVGGFAFPSYSHASQYISELGARGAPNAELVNLAGFLPAGLLISAFVYLAWKALPRSRLASLGLLGIAFFALGYIGAAFFPCDAGCRPTERSFSQTAHEVFGLAGYLTAPPALLALGWRARSWLDATWLSVLGFVSGGLTLLCLLFMSPAFEYAGAAQRVLEASMLTWIVACAVYINRRGRSE
ncbi:MAG: DUF998 domain-containing protein [Gemmatimonadota bacterium]